jgi:hypothetical protein
MHGSSACNSVEVAKKRLVGVETWQRAIYPSINGHQPMKAATASNTKPGTMYLSFSLQTKPNRSTAHKHKTYLRVNEQRAGIGVSSH